MTPLPEPTRRAFLVQLPALGVLLSRPGGLLAQETLPARAIPGTGEALPVIGLGSTKAVLEIPTAGTAPLGEVLRTLLRFGGRVVDTSPRAEAIDGEFGKVLNEPDLKGKLFLATKINTDGRQAGIDQMRQNQRLLGGRPLDLVQVESLLDVETHWPNVRGWKESGEARYIGVTVSSNDAQGALEAFMESETPDFVHVNYSVMETGAEERILPLARERGMAVLINRPFMNGSYFTRTAGRALPEWAVELGCESWAQFSLKYILSHPAVTSVMTETTDREHMEENIRAAFGSLPDEATRQRMRELARTL